MKEYETFKKWVNSFGVKIYYKLKPPTKKELYEIATRQEEEIEKLNNIIKEIRELCLMFASGRLERTNYDDILEVIDKVGVDK